MWAVTVDTAPGTGYSPRMAIAQNLSEKTRQYGELLAASQALLAGEDDLVANMSNLTALVFQTLPDLNGVFFYRWLDGELIVGPFQGRVACVHIAAGRGVCGRVADTRRPEVVPNVLEFPGHIACDERSRSEVVVPVLTPAGDFFGVLDVDSPVLDRFDDVDAKCLQRLGSLIFSR